MMFASIGQGCIAGSGKDRKVAVSSNKNTQKRLFMTAFFGKIEKTVAITVDEAGIVTKGVSDVCGTDRAHV